MEEPITMLLEIMISCVLNEEGPNEDLKDLNFIYFFFQGPITFFPYYKGQKGMNILLIL